jgi:hypothetical protein
MVARAWRLPARHLNTVGWDVEPTKGLIVPYSEAAWRGHTRQAAAFAPGPTDALADKLAISPGEQSDLGRCGLRHPGVR